MRGGMCRGRRRRGVRARVRRWCGRSLLYTRAGSRLVRFEAGSALSRRWRRGGGFRRVLLPFFLLFGFKSLLTLANETTMFLGLRFYRQFHLSFRFTF